MLLLSLQALHQGRLHHVSFLQRRVTRFKVGERAQRSLCICQLLLHGLVLVV
jgi:hypothetical protein